MRYAAILLLSLTAATPIQSAVNAVNSASQTVTNDIAKLTSDQAALQAAVNTLDNLTGGTNNTTSCGDLVLSVACNSSYIAAM